MSTARGSEPRSGAQPPAEPGSFDPALDHLISALTTPGHPHELGGRDSALAAFRAVSRPTRRAARHAARQREFGPFLLPVRLAALVAAGVTVVAGVTAAAYAQALPAPVQKIAYSVLAPIGVPDNRAKPSTSPTPSRTTSSGPSATPSGSPVNTVPGSGPSAVPAASPSATAAGYAVTLKVIRAQLPTRAFAQFEGTATHYGRPAAGELVRLLERPRGASRWQLAASGRTGRLGRISFSVQPAAETALFMLAGPGGARSAVLTVTATPPLTFWLQAGRTTERLHVAAPFSKPGTAVDLMERIKGTWITVSSESLGGRHRVVFILPTSTAAGHLYQAEVKASGLTSSQILIPAYHTGAKAITTSPSPTGTPSPSATSSPAPTGSPGPSAPPSPPGSSSPPTPSSSPSGTTSPSAGPPSA